MARKICQLTAIEMNPPVSRRFPRTGAAPVLVHFTALLLVIGSMQPSASGDDRVVGPSASGGPTVPPEPVTAQHFEALRTHSPFLRSLDLSKAVVLTGVARIEGELVATLFNREINKTQVVSQSSSASPDGWRLLGVEGDRNLLESLTVQVAVSGGEVISVRIDPAQVQPATDTGGGPQIPAEKAQDIAEQARNFRQGFSGDGLRGPPSPEVVQKLSQLNEQQRGQVIFQLQELRDEGISSEERQKAIPQLVDRALRQGR